MKDFLKYMLATIVGLIIAGIVGFFLLIGVFSAIMSYTDKPVVVEDNSVLILDFKNEIVERAANTPFDDFSFNGFYSSGKTGLDNILESIEKAKTDDQIKGIYLCPSGIQAGVATVEEIRKALIDFKESGKFVYAYGDSFSQKAYYLVSVADQIALNPQGMLELKGLSSVRTFYKKALEKLGVEMQIIRHGKFKAAVEPFIREDMSPENKLQTQTYLNSVWSAMVEDIAASRKLSPEAINQLADSVTMFMPAEELVKAGLIDTLMYKDEMINTLKELTGIDMEDDVPAIGVDKYAKVPASSGKGLIRDKIAVIYAEGDIDGTDTDGIKSEALSRTIREARRDSSIKAIVLRVNSPGGSAYGSEVIWREVKLAKETKPVIVSMGDVAASGGYYISAAADTIMADRTTITGSIGIFGMIPNAGELLNDKLGITEDVVSTNANSDLLSVTRPLTGFERSKMQAYIERGYDTFIGRVADGRTMTKEQVDEIGQGRVWASSNAKEIGLVDLYGGVTDAVKLAAQMAKLEDYRITKLPKLKDPLEELLKDLTGEAQSFFMERELGDQYKLYEQLKNVVNSKGILARMPYDIKFE
ncbi:signal peptide peptidase SppA [Mangrovibacterium diazotrophicum]|uniref:Signal peptide peptidase A n=1 Tax=Mangrovibacterium diazotrophicum TaxID=1261403 RepID=A0A419WB47_9BACT|nr:signal peptide peptidase SppA [Mangrovibacterium diazotrophicum]RKD92695.1 signal peptide peptidase A [Mangrovibacterium diazotrophicum]